MPRKPQPKKEQISITVNRTLVSITLHPPTGRRKSWYAYWKGLKTSRSTGQVDKNNAIQTVAAMLQNDEKTPTVDDAVLTDEEFEAIQRKHFARKKDPAAQERAVKSLQCCLEAINAFKVISDVQPITLATPDDCAAFQSDALTLPKNTLRPYPKGKEDIACYSPNTVIKWSVALKAAWERVCRTSGKKCVRGVVDESKLLAENPWRQFTWIEGFHRPIRQFDRVELLSLLEYLNKKWAGITVATALAKTFLWSCARRQAVCSLKWDQLRIVGLERHFQIVDKWGIKRWFRVPEGLYNELLQIKTATPYVFAAYTDQLREFYKNSSRPGMTKIVGEQFKPVCLGDWFHERISDWSTSLSKGHAHIHIFRKTGLQYARRGEDVIGKVAKDAGVSAKVMVAHYVEEKDPELRDASNRTYERLQASLPGDVARRYGYVESMAEQLEEKLQLAIACKDWSLATELSAQLTRQTDSEAG